MNPERASQLRKLLENDPNDPFLKYALALEYVDHNTEYSFRLFTELIKDHPDYAPTYYHAANLFTDLGYMDLAKDTFEKGIEITKDDPKANQELRSAYQNFLFEYED